MKNYYWGAFLVTALVLIILLALNLLPDYQLFGHKMRRVDMLSELRYDKPVAALSEDTVKLEEIVEKKEIITDYVDTCEAGVTCIVDYSDSTHRGMSHFYAVLDSVADLDRPVRIAVFGDSFIEGDIFTADLREMLQQHYGGKGVGYVNITSNVANFRPTVIHKFEGWQSHSVIDSICDRAMLGLNSTYYKPRTPQAFVSLEGTSRYATGVAEAEVSQLYFMSDSSRFTLSCSVNGAEAEPLAVSGSGLRTARVSGGIKSVKWIVNDSVPAVFWGVTMESRHGVVVDNMSLRGSAGFNFLSIPEARLRQFAAARAYDLIILQYGLNVASENRTSYSGYKKSMEQVIAKLKSCFPTASFLLMSVGDRMMKDDDGNLVTMPGIINLVNYQEAIAADSGIAFWNLFSAFKSLGGIKAFAEAQPPMANLDYTHINFRGGKKLAAELVKALMNGKENFDKANGRAAD